MIVRREQAGAIAHLPAAVFCAALAVMLTWPLALHLTTHVPGTGPDDNMAFLWDFWWMRRALANGGPLFHTNAIFFPFGANLALHTHVAFNAFIGATVLSSLSVVAALNTMILISSALSAFTTYLLVDYIVMDRRAALIAGAGLASSAAMNAHLFGHFNYYSAWVLPLFALCSLRFRDRPTAGRAIVAGAALACVVYMDYYYAIYALVFVLCLVTHVVCDAKASMSAPRSMSGADYILIELIAIATGFCVWIAFTGGTDVTVAGHRISLNSGANVRAVIIILGAWIAIRRWRIRMSFAFRHIESVSRVGVGMAVGAAVCGALIAPLLIAALEVVLKGDYVSQHYFWRSSPQGADMGGLLLGNPFSWIGRHWAHDIYQRLSMSEFDGPAWLGVGAIVAWMGRRHWSKNHQAGPWKLVAVVFFVWALGPRLRVFGLDMGLPLPATLFHFVPIMSNVRIPGHAIIMVCIAVAVLFGIALAADPRWRSRNALIVLALILLADGYSAPLVLYGVERPAIYTTLRSLPDGGVLELPLGIRDGFGERGHIDPAVMFYQSIHGKPIVSGYLARLPNSLRAAFEQSPTLSTLLDLSGFQNSPSSALVSGADASAELRQLGIRYIVVNKRLAARALQDFAQQLSTRVIAEGDGRVLLEFRPSS